MDMILENPFEAAETLAGLFDHENQVQSPSEYQACPDLKVKSSAAFKSCSSHDLNIGPVLVGFQTFFIREQSQMT